MVKMAVRFRWELKLKNSISVIIVSSAASFFHKCFRWCANEKLVYYHPKEKQKKAEFNESKR